MPETDPIAAVNAYLEAPQLVGWQFAANGKWDAAETVFFERPIAEDIAHIQRWCTRQESGNIAFEALFETGAKEHFFFGVRVTRLSPAKKADAVELLLSRSQKTQPLPQTVDRIRVVLGQPHLATTKPDYMEIGVFQMWNRVKPVVVWETGGTVIPHEDICKYSRPPDGGFAPLHEPQTNALMLEAAWHQGSAAPEDFQCWISLPIGVKNKMGKYILSKDRYEKAVKVFIG